MNTPSIVPGWLRPWRPIDYPRQRRDLPASIPPPPREPLRRAVEILRRGAADRRQIREAAQQLTRS